MQFTVLTAYCTLAMARDRNISGNVIENNGGPDFVRLPTPVICLGK